MTTQNNRTPALTLLAAVALTFPLHAAFADTAATWNGANSTWSNAADWSLPNYPTNGTPAGALYDVTINSGIITLDVDPTIQTLSLSNANFIGNGTITSNALFTLSGAGDYQNTNFQANGGATFQSLNNTVLYNSTISNAVGQTANWNSGELYLQGNSSITNNGTLNANSGGMMIPTSNFYNAGTLNVPTFDVFSIDSGLHNSGNIAIGTFANLYANGGDGGTPTTGSVTIAANGQLILNSGFSFASASSISGPGSVQFNNGTINFAGTYNITGPTDFTGASVAFTSHITSLGSQVTLSGGDVNFGDNSLTLTSLTWNSGTLSGTGTYSTSGLLNWSFGTLAANLTASGGIAFHDINGATISNATLTVPAGGTVSLGDDGPFPLSLQNGAHFRNAGTFTATNGSISDSGGNASLFTNSGNFITNLVVSTFTFPVGVPFSNTGNVTVQAGTLSLTAGDAGATTGRFNVAANAKLSLGGNFTLSGAATITGAGNATITGILTAASGLSIANLLINGALRIQPNGTSTAASRFSTLTLAGGSSPTATFDLSNNVAIVEPSQSAKPSLFSTLQAQALYGRTHATGILGATLPPNTVIAILDNAITQFTIFAGQPVDAGSLLLTPELLGDANIDGHVDLSDLSTILNNFGATTPNWTSGNFDNQPTIDLTDLSDVLNNFGQSNPAATTDLASAFSATVAAPEPASLLILMPLAAVFLFHRRRHSPFSP